jgi:hypothetical protein
VGAARLGLICDALERAAAAGHVDAQFIKAFSRALEPTQDALTQLLSRD